MTNEDQTQDSEPVESPVNITIPEPEEPANDNGTSDIPQAASGEPRPTRAQQKEMRFRHLTEARTRADQAERRLAAEGEERRKLALEVAELRGRQQAEYARRQYEEQGDPTEKRISEAHDAAWKKLQAAATSQDAERSAEAMREYHQALTQASEIAAERKIAAEMNKFRQSMPDPQTQRMKDALESEFEWLGSNAAARTLADGYVGYLTAQKGRPWNLQTYREACAMAAKEFGLGGGAGRPSDARRAAYSGVPGRSSGAGGGGGDQLQVTSDDAGRLKKMATKLYPEMEPDAAYKKWLGTVGQRLRK
jgi:hypothetical protein